MDSYKITLSALDVTVPDCSIRVLGSYISIVRSERTEDVSTPLSLLYT